MMQCNDCDLLFASSKELANHVRLFCASRGGRLAEPRSVAAAARKQLNDFREGREAERDAAQAAGLASMADELALDTRADALLERRSAASHRQEAGLRARAAQMGADTRHEEEIKGARAARPPAKPSRAPVARRAQRRHGARLRQREARE